MTALAAAPTIRREQSSSPGSAAVLTLERTASPDEVCDLIAAAGPLTVRDIAGGLAVSARQASASVQLMVRRNCLKQDEFRRYRLSGTCVMR